MHAATYHNVITYVDDVETSDNHMYNCISFPRYYLHSPINKLLNFQMNSSTIYLYTPMIQISAVVEDEWAI